MNYNDYEPYDWIGSEDFREKAYKSKRERTRLFELFKQRLPSATKELQKVVPHIKLDHSFESLEKLDAWLKHELDIFIHEHPDDIPYLSVPRNAKGLLPYDPNPFNAVPAFWRSLGSDMYIYCGECILHAAKTEGLHPEDLDLCRLRWEVSDGKAMRGGAGFPQIVGDGPFINLNYGGMRGYIGDIAHYMANPVMNDYSKVKESARLTWRAKNMMGSLRCRRDSAPIEKPIK